VNQEIVKPNAFLYITREVPSCKKDVEDIFLYSSAEKSSDLMILKICRLSHWKS